MRGKRKDSKGRVLHTGEYQRPNGTYQYRYTNKMHKTHSIYAKTLDALRRLEEDVQRDQLDGIDSSAGDMTVSDLVDQYISLKRGLSPNTLRAYSSPINYIHSSYFGMLKVKQVKPSTAKAFYIQLHDEGKKRGTITCYHCLLHPAFEMAVEDDMIRKNPFKFQISDLLPDDRETRVALTRAQQQSFLDFLRDYARDDYYNEIVILLETGLRVSEMYGLTRRDVDFKHRCIHIDHQLCRTAEKPYFITTPKTKSGNRTIPMSDVAFATFHRILKARPKPKVEMMVDGYSNFVFLDKDGKPKVGMHLQNYMRRLRPHLVQLYGNSFPRVTPHVLRHTFCTNMVNAGIDVKSLQYLMGHSNVSVTLDIYTHTDYNTVRSAFLKATASM